MGQTRGPPSGKPPGTPKRRHPTGYNIQRTIQGTPSRDSHQRTTFRGPSPGDPLRGPNPGDTLRRPPLRGLLRWTPIGKPATGEFQGSSPQGTLFRGPIQVIPSREPPPGKPVQSTLSSRHPPGEPLQRNPNIGPPPGERLQGNRIQVTTCRGSPFNPPHLDILQENPFQPTPTGDQSRRPLLWDSFRGPPPRESTMGLQLGDTKNWSA
jgi:hypothetical protein